MTVMTIQNHTCRLSSYLKKIRKPNTAPQFNAGKAISIRPK